MQSSTAKGTQEVIRGLLQDSRKKTISFSGRDMIPYTGRKSEKWAQEDQRRASAMELNHCRPDRTSQREIPVQKWQMEYECISTDRKLAIGQYCLIFTSPASGLQRFFVGFSCLWVFFSKVTTRFWQISSHDQPYSPFLPTQTLLFPICKEQHREKSSQASISSLITLTLYIRRHRKTIQNRRRNLSHLGEFLRTDVICSMELLTWG